MAMRSHRPLDARRFPMQLWEKAKVQGTWNPADIDYAADGARWMTLSRDVQHGLRQLCALFRAGERAVTLHLPPFIHVVASEGRLEEAVYLSSFLWEEAKHLDLFDRFFARVCGAPRSTADEGSAYCTILDEELGGAMERLLTDRSPVAQVRASVTYHLVVEGVMAEAGYRLFLTMTDGPCGLPAMRRAMTLLHRDESRHVAFGMYFLSRLIIEHGNEAYGALLRRMSELKPLTEAATRDFVRSVRGCVPTTEEDELIRWSRQQFERRMQRLAKARTQRMADLDAAAVVAGARE